MKRTDIFSAYERIPLAAVSGLPADSPLVLMGHYAEKRKLTRLRVDESVRVAAIEKKEKRKAEQLLARKARVKWIRSMPDSLLLKLDRRQLVEEMKRAGLYAASTYYLDTAINALIAEAGKGALIKF